MSTETKREVGFLGNLRTEYISILVGLGSFIVFAPDIMNEFGQIMNWNFTVSFYTFLLFYFILPVVGTIAWLYGINSAKDGLKALIIEKRVRLFKNGVIKKYLSFLAALTIVNTTFLLYYRSGSVSISFCLSLLLLGLNTYYIYWIFNHYNSYKKSDDLRLVEDKRKSEYLRRIRQINLQYCFIFVAIILVIVFTCFTHVSGKKLESVETDQTLKYYENYNKLKESKKNFEQYSDLIFHKLDTTEGLGKTLLAVDFILRDSCSLNKDSILIQTLDKDSILIKDLDNKLNTLIKECKAHILQQTAACDSGIEKKPQLDTLINKCKANLLLKKVACDTGVVKKICTDMYARMTQTFSPEKKVNCDMGIVKKVFRDLFDSAYKAGLPKKETTFDPEMIKRINAGIDFRIKRSELITKNGWAPLLNLVQLKSLMVLITFLILLLTIWYQAYQENLLHNLVLKPEEEVQFSEIDICTKCIYIISLLMLPFFRSVDARDINLEKPFIKPIANEKILNSDEGGKRADGKRKDTLSVFTKIKSDTLYIRHLNKTQDTAGQGEIKTTLGKIQKDIKNIPARVNAFKLQGNN